ncbi:MAG: hypothetical protein J0H02_06225 [Armatimonadetes bacterium]|nr:hypothetical protein [Armatimonadota bacterium]
MAVALTAGDRRLHHALDVGLSGQLRGSSPRLVHNEDTEHRVRECGVLSPKGFTGRFGPGYTLRVGRREVEVLVRALWWRLRSRQVDRFLHLPVVETGARM